MTCARSFNTEYIFYFSKPTIVFFFQNWLGCSLTWNFYLKLTWINLMFYFLKIIIFFYRINQFFYWFDPYEIALYPHVIKLICWTEFYNYSFNLFLGMYYIIIFFCYKLTLSMIKIGDSLIFRHVCSCALQVSFLKWYYYGKKNQVFN